MIGKQVGNIIHSNNAIENNLPINILYEPSRSLFDDVLFDKLSNINLIDYRLQELFGIYYSLLIVNDPISFAQNTDKYAEAYTREVIFLHNEAPAQFKKEDLSLIYGALKSYRKINFNYENTNWNMPNTIEMLYGIPSYDKNPIIKNKDVLLLNLEQSNFVKNLFGILKSSFPDLLIDQVEQFSNIEEAINIISSYKIVIDFNHKYNSLFAMSRGCYSISNQNLGIDMYNSSVDNPAQIVGLISNIVKSYSEETSDFVRSKIIEKYSFDKFEKSLRDILLLT